LQSAGGHEYSLSTGNSGNFTSSFFLFLRCILTLFFTNNAGQRIAGGVIGIASS